MIRKVLERHDPKQRNSHTVLRFFSEDLSEEENLEFIKAIFERGSWTLPTQISKSSQSLKIQEETKDIFKKILQQWVDERIDFSERFSDEIKNVYIPRFYKNEFREAILATRDLGFHPELMTIIETLVIKSNEIYLKTFLDNAFGMIVEEFNTEELEEFFIYFSRVYIGKRSRNLGSFIYIFLENLVESSKIYFLSKSFFDVLEVVSTTIKERDLSENSSMLIPLLLIEFLTEKKLDLGKGDYSDLISPILDNLEKGKLESLPILTFLNNHNYSFSKYDFNIESKFLLDSIESNLEILSKSDESGKQSIFHHFNSASQDYLELLIIHLSYIEESKSAKILENYIELVDRVRVYGSEIQRFTEYDNFSLVEGEIVNSDEGGFYVELKQNREKYLSVELHSKFNQGYLNLSTVTKHDDAKRFLSHLNEGGALESYSRINDDESVCNIKQFQISSVNYSSSNKKSINRLIPYNENLAEITSNLRIRSFFSCNDIFLIGEVCRRLNVKFPFRKSLGNIHVLIPTIFDSYPQINISDDLFFTFLSKVRPSIHSKLYVKTNENRISFNKLKEAFSNGEILIGEIVSLTNGGWFVNVNDYLCFLPGSQIEVSPVLNFKKYVGRSIDVRVIKVLEDSRSIIVSHRILIEAEIEKERERIISNLNIGDILEGRVKNITSYGAFIDLGGIDGLIHVTDLSWHRVSHPDKILNLDEVIKVVVLSFDANKSRIGLGLKQLSENPWNKVVDKIQRNSFEKGIISSENEYGYFVKLHNVEGFLNHKKINDDRYKGNIKIGDEVVVKILFVDSENMKISLALNKQKRITKERPELNFNAFIRKNDKGSIIGGEIQSIRKGMGIIKTEFNISCACPYRYMSDENGKKLNKGAKLNFIIIDIDERQKKVYLRPLNSHKIESKENSIPNQSQLENLKAKFNRV